MVPTCVYRQIIVHYRSIRGRIVLLCGFDEIIYYTDHGPVLERRNVVDDDVHTLYCIMLCVPADISRAYRYAIGIYVCVCVQTRARVDRLGMDR